MPDEWSIAVIAKIFKKKDPADCNNYRPISLLSVAYKIFAAIIKQRILDGGGDAVLWKSQFGFRAECSNEDAIYIARRRIELARAQRGGKAMLLALDWQRAFDSVNCSSLLDGLGRFGLSAELLAIIGGMLQERTFSVREGADSSSPQPQLSGISQWCTLSPLIFVMVMSVLLHDAHSMLSPSAKSAYEAGDLSDLVYADETMLMSVRYASARISSCSICCWRPQRNGAAQ